MIIGGTIAPPNTPRSVTMLPLGEEASPFVPELEPIHDPSPHYHDYAVALAKRNAETEAARQTSTVDQQGVITTTKAVISPALQQFIERVRRRTTEDQRSATEGAPKKNPGPARLL